MEETMYKNYYTDEYYHEKRNKYLHNYFDADIKEALLNSYAAFCGIVLVDGDEAKLPVISFMAISYLFLGKGIYDFYKVIDIESKWKNGEGLTEPLKLRKIKQYK